MLATRPIVLEAVRDRMGTRGSVAWTTARAPDVDILSASAAGPVVLRGDLELGTGAAVISRAVFDFAFPNDEALRLTASVGGRVVDQLNLPPVQSPVYNRRSADFGVISVVVPIFAGFEATRSCLDALAAQRCGLILDVIVIDDASPDVELAGYAARTCKDHGWLHVRHTVNAGFAASINHGLGLCRGGHVLLLNADAVLPPGALDRLLAAAEEPDVGTVVPFSNDGGFTSFPVMRASNRAPTASEMRDIDDAARRANAGELLDLPAGTAFCMLITHACLNAVGGLDHRYGRGYFEDVDLCLRARRLGFRNVLAADLYVAHAGSQSFGRSKHALAARNALLLRDRFPDYELDWACFVRADPLASLRAAIERDLGAKGPVQLLVGRGSRFGAVLGRRTAELARDAPRVITVSWRRDGAIMFSGADGEVPQNLVFAHGEDSSCADYLRRLDLASIEIAEPDAVPPGLLSALLGAGAPVTIYVADRAAARIARERTAPWLRDVSVTAADSLAAAYLGGALPIGSAKHRRGDSGNEPDRQPPRARSTLPKVCIGVLMPIVTIDAARFLSILARRLVQRRSAALVVLGPALDGAGFHDMANVHITGPMAPSEYPMAARHHDITHVLLPYRDRLFRTLEDLQNTVVLPAAYFDWSAGRHVRGSDDLALSSEIDDDEAAAAVALWCGCRDRVTAAGEACSA